jgi:hypothetical protein
MVHYVRDPLHAVSPIASPATARIEDGRRETIERLSEELELESTLSDVCGELSIGTVIIVQRRILQARRLRRCRSVIQVLCWRIERLTVRFQFRITVAGARVMWLLQNTI